jgi:hypothetical protein
MAGLASRVAAKDLVEQEQMKLGQAPIDKPM